jgi:hypothetical protein
MGFYPHAEVTGKPAARGGTSAFAMPTADRGQLAGAGGSEAPGSKYPIANKEYPISKEEAAFPMVIDHSVLMIGYSLKV